MDLTIEEFQKMTDDRSLQAIRMAMLEQQINEKNQVIEALKNRVECLEMTNTAERLTNLLLKNYITLSVGKIRTFLTHLKGIERFAFLKAFLEYVLPSEHYQEQLLLVNEVMIIPEEPKQAVETHNHFEAGSGCQVFNERVIGQFDK